MSFFLHIILPFTIITHCPSSNLASIPSRPKVRLGSSGSYEASSPPALNLPLSPYPILQPLGYQTLEKLQDETQTHSRSHRHQSRRCRSKSPHRLQTQPPVQSQHNRKAFARTPREASQYGVFEAKIKFFLASVAPVDEIE